MNKSLFKITLFTMAMGLGTACCAWKLMIENFIVSKFNVKLERPTWTSIFSGPTGTKTVSDIVAYSPPRVAKINPPPLEYEAENGDLLTISLLKDYKTPSIGTITNTWHIYTTDPQKASTLRISHPYQQTGGAYDVTVDVYNMTIEPVDCHCIINEHN